PRGRGPVRPWTSTASWRWAGLTRPHSRRTSPNRRGPVIGVARAESSRGALSEDPAHGLDQLAGREGLGDVGGGPDPLAQRAVGRVRVPRDDDDGDEGRPR